MSSSSSDNERHEAYQKPSEEAERRDVDERELPDYYVPPQLTTVSPIETATQAVKTGLHLAEMLQKLCSGEEDFNDLVECRRQIDGAKRSLAENDVLEDVLRGLGYQLAKASSSLAGNVIDIYVIETEPAEPVFGLNGRCYHDIALKIISKIVQQCYDRGCSRSFTLPIDKPWEHRCEINWGEVRVYMANEAPQLWDPSKSELTREFDFLISKVGREKALAAKGTPLITPGLESEFEEPELATNVNVPASETLADQKSSKQTKSANAKDGDSKRARQPTVNDRMEAKLASDMHTVKGWTAQQWADHLGCGKTTVIDTQTWKSLSLLRQQAKAEKRRDRRGTKPV